MSDENTEATPDTPGTDAPDPTESVEKLKAELDKWKGLSRKNEDRARENAEAAKAWAAYQESAKTEEQKRNEELEQLRTRAEKLEHDLARKDRDILAQRIAADKGVPVKYLVGDTEEALVASADEFLNDVQTIAPAKPSGYVPSQGTGDPTPPTASLDDVRERARKQFASKK